MAKRRHCPSPFFGFIPWVRSVRCRRANLSTTDARATVYLKWLIAPLCENVEGREEHAPFDCRLGWVCGNVGRKGGACCLGEP